MMGNKKFNYSIGNGLRVDDKLSHRLTEWQCKVMARKIELSRSYSELVRCIVFELGTSCTNRVTRQ